MKQHEFEAEHAALWLRIDAALQQPAKGDNAHLLAQHYLGLCQQLAIAKERMYDSALVEQLNNRVPRSVPRTVSLSRRIPLQFLRLRQTRFSTRDLSPSILCAGGVSAIGRARAGRWHLDLLRRRGHLQRARQQPGAPHGNASTIPRRARSAANAPPILTS